MYITAKYILTLESSGEYLCKNLEKPICPCCGTKLKYRDTRRRIMKKEGGVVIFFDRGYPYVSYIFLIRL